LVDTFGDTPMKGLKKLHEAAARQYEEAAEHHRTAAASASDDDLIDAAYHGFIAQGCALRGHEFAGQAMKKQVNRYVRNAASADGLIRLNGSDRDQEMYAPLERLAT